MIKQRALDTVKDFCQAWFVERDVEKAVLYLSDDVTFAGTAAHEQANGKVEMRAYICQDIAEIPVPFTLSYCADNEQDIAPGVCVVTLNQAFCNQWYTWRLRLDYVLSLANGRWLIRHIHAAEPGNNQMGQEHYPQTLVMESISKMRSDLFNSAVAGGMMGGYIEENFPFYFINERMLEYLGYESEESFLSDTGGMISFCMHPDDRAYVEGEVERQLAGGDEYTVEYRMRKKDGSYIWVHDIGKKIVAENGKPAIISVCIDITEQRRAQQDMLSLYNNIPGAVFQCGCREPWPVLAANDGLYEFLGYSREEFGALGHTMASVTYGEDFSALRSRLDALSVSGNATLEMETRLVCKQGNVKWISLKARLCSSERGDYLYCVLVDVTNARAARLRQKEQYAREQQYSDELARPDLMNKLLINLSHDTVESYVGADNVAVPCDGVDYTSAMQRLKRRVVDPTMAAELDVLWERAKLLSDYEQGHTDHRIEYRRCLQSGAIIWCRTTAKAYQNPLNGDIMLFMYTFDITDAKMAENVLQNSMEFTYDYIVDIDIRRDTYRMLSGNAEVQSLIPPSGSFTARNRRYAETRIKAESDRAFFYRMVDFSYMTDRLEKSDCYSFEISVQDDAGDTRIKNIQLSYIDKLLGRVCMTRTDVTDVIMRESEQRENLAAALAAAKQANAAKSDFLSRMSHEIRTPMNAIIGLSTIAAQATGDEERVKDCISKIGISSRYLLSLINDILDMSRIESGKMLLKSEAFDLPELLSSINSICYSQAESKSVEFECIVDPMLEDKYVGDAMRLQQVLINILGNAIKFTGEGGKVTFSASLRRKIKNHAQLRFIINDTGIGMAQEFLPHLFEPFSQESSGTTALYGGTGLGLSISKSIVDMMNGQIDVRSILGVGSEFTVDVMLGMSEEEQRRHCQKVQSLHFSHLKTLVVDDDAAVCQGAVVTLRELGMTAEWVDSGLRAVERVQRLSAAGQHYDMILIDWKMPEMDGIETARRIRHIVGPDVTIIIMTAYDWAAIEHEAKMAGVNLMMSKPMLKSTLVSAFSRALGEKEQTAAKPEDYDFTGRRVLLVEDHPLNAEIAAALLSAKGVDVLVAENGLRALELFSKSSKGYFDAILMDIRMPVMDGLTACANIRRLSNADATAIPIIAMTANAFDDDVEKSRRAGMNAHLAKPIDAQRLYATLADLISRRPEQAAKV